MNSPDLPADQNQNSPSASSAPRSINDTVDKIRSATTETTTKAKDKVVEMASEGKNAAADKVAGYSGQLRDAAKSAEAAKDPNIAHFAGQAADRLDQAANYVRDADLNRLREDATQVARRHPALFLGGMLVAGLVLGNLAKASFQSLSDSGENDEADEDKSGRGDDNPSSDHAHSDASSGNGEAVGVGLGGYAGNPER